MKKVSIIILNWNRADDTIECLESLSKIDTQNLTVEIIVVDNASRQNELKKLRNFIIENSLEIRNLRLEINPENLGFAEGNNIGIRRAMANGTDYVLVINNDTVVDKDFLINLIKVAEKNKKAGVLSPKIYFAKGFEFHKERYKNQDLGKVIWYSGGIIDWNNIYGSNRGVDEVDRGQFERIEETDFATGACMLLKKRAIADVGLFDNKYFMYLEDVDLSQRMIKKGWKVLYVPQSHIWHKVARSSGIGSNLNDYFITRNRLLFGIKYAKLKTKLLLLQEAFKFLIFGRQWQKIGSIDFFLCNFGKGSWK
jgi:hypothetical protein